MTSTISAIDDILLSGRKYSEYVHRRSLDQFVDRLVLPGMVLHIEDKLLRDVSWCVGPGISVIPTSTPDRSNKLPKSVVILQLGTLRRYISSDHSDGAHSVSREPTLRRCFLWVERPILPGPSKSLAPLCRSTFRCTNDQFHVGDRVVGIVTRRIGDFYAVDIGCANPASLNYLSFVGASKKNRPDIGPGDVIYATVTQADRDLEIELSCVDEAGRASGMGILGRHEPGTVGNAGGMAGGILLRGSPELIQRLSKQKEYPLLPLLEKAFSFEIFLGTNGRIWLTAPTVKETILLANILSLAEHASFAECFELCSLLNPRCQMECSNGQ